MIHMDTEQASIPLSQDAAENAVPAELLAQWLDTYGTCDRDNGKQNDCYWGKDAAGRENGCLKTGWRGRSCPHWTPIAENELAWLIAAHTYWDKASEVSDDR